MNQVRVLSRLLISLALVLPAARAALPAEGPGAPRRLRVEYLENPLGLDEPRPRFSFELDDARRGAVQSAYEIRVGEDGAALRAGEHVLWTSGKVASPATSQIEYAGPVLVYDHEYSWQVRSFDGQDAASPWSELATWRMGPFTVADWKARWISDPDPVREDQAVSDGWRTHAHPAQDDLQWVQIDFGTSQVCDEIRFYPTRTQAGDGYLFPLKYRVWMAEEPTFLKQLPQMPIHIVDQTFADQKNPGSEVVSNKLVARTKVRYLRFGFLKLPQVKGQGSGNGDVGFATALSEIEVLDSGHVVSRGARVTCSDSVEEGGWSLRNLFDGVLGSRPASPAPPPPAPALRREFELAAGVKRATVYASARGLYELRINGARVGERVLAPEWTHYAVRTQYQAYDVTALLKQGPNALAALLGDGWYAGRLGLTDDFTGSRRRGFYGTQPSLLAQLEVDLEDGSHVTIASDAQWKSSLDGPIRASDLLDGETIDARKDLGAWDRPGFSAGASWRNVQVAAGQVQGLVAQKSEPVRVAGELKAQSIAEPEKGVYVIDFGRIVNGWCRLTCSGGKAGSTIELRHVEAAGAGGSAAQTDRFVLRGSGQESFEPRFTLHGFRYVEVRGLEKKPELGDLVALEVLNAARPTATFACSEPVLEGLWQSVVATQRSNLNGTFASCGARGDRGAWLVDFGACAQSAMYSLDLAGFVGKWCSDVRDARAADGRLPDLAPNPCDPEHWYSSTPGACDAAFSVPWTAWVNYGDRRLLERDIDALTKHADFILNQSRSYRWLFWRGEDSGDLWNGSTIEAPGWDKKGCDMPRDALATAYLWQSTDTLVRMRKLLGLAMEPGRGYTGQPGMKYPDLAQHLSFNFNHGAEQQPATMQGFVNPQGRIDGDTQAGYALALSTNVLEKDMRPKVLGQLHDSIAKRDGQLTTGVLTTHHALIELSRGGLPADKLLCQPQTMLERREGLAGALNHLGFTSIGEWMMGWLVGLRPDEAQPGWHHFFVAPAPCEKVSSARGTHDSIAGHIEASWKKGAEGYELELVVPPNTTASVTLPAAEQAALFEGDQPIQAAAPFVSVSSRKNGQAQLEVAAGRYHFRVGR